MLWVAVTVSCGLSGEVTIVVRSSTRGVPGRSAAGTTACTPGSNGSTVVTCAGCGATTAINFSRNRGVRPGLLPPC
ncbi:hypothetical protein D3C80_831150 [compost metagenome]